MKTERALKVLRSLVRGHKVSRVRAMAAIADLLGDRDPDKNSLPSPGSAIVLLAFAEYVAEHDFAPSIRDLEKRTGRTKSTIHEHLARLERRRMLKRTLKGEYRFRNLQLTRIGKKYVAEVWAKSDVRP